MNKATISSGMEDLLKRGKSLMGYEERPKEWYEEIEAEVCSICPSLTYQQRIGGCMVCMTIGFLISFGSLFRIVQLLTGNPTPFAIMYTIGNVISICSTCFLYGPYSQAKKMFATTRIVSTCLYLFFMGLTLFLAFFPGNIPGRIFLLVFAILFQFMALVWYTLSFIPFARDLVKNCCLDTCCARFRGQDDGFWA